MPIGRRALNWHASLCVNGATAEGVQVPRTSEIEGTCCAAPLQRRRHGGRTDCGSSDRCRDPSVVRSSDSRVTPPKNDLRSELARPRTSGARILTARKHLRRTKGEPSRCRALGLILPSRSLDQQTSPPYSRLLNPSSHWQTDTNKRKSRTCRAMPCSQFGTPLRWKHRHSSKRVRRRSTISSSRR